MSLLKAQDQPATTIARKAFEQHSTYKEQALQHRRFKHQDIVPLLERLRQHPLFEVQVAGQSVEQRDIYLVKAGTGKTKVMLWSQMHGDEPTATMALFDLFNFLQQSDELDPVRRQLLENTTLYFVPMLNPDGAERYTRHNALEIDLNRDALRLQSPEARLLKGLRDSLNPEFGFNLHDQSRYYTVGTTPMPATISFLAPAFDYDQTVNEVRERAMRTIVGMNEALQQLVPGHVAKYSDEFEPRAFGDNIQKWGTSLILIESGGYPSDPEKQVIRQLNFASIVSALHLISGNGYTNYELEDYYKIPENERNLYDLVLRNVRYTRSGHDVLLDIGIFREEVEAPVAKGFYHSSTVDQIGDLSVFHGYEEVDASGLTLVPGKVYQVPFKRVEDLKPHQAKSLLEEGYTTVQVEELPADAGSINPLELPLNITRTASEKASHELLLENSANFTLKDAQGKLRYAILNGFVYDLHGDRPELFHGLVL
ncbi:M14 family metallopeptidase [Pontibacter litorisediminis]|uniref:M14 family metallopeptidase n=1 Tax=Pontibacter litorisediminis TaxID=1846260 RepID=UPI0023ED62FB|nr:M14 metallopeptidase family protein [Pontibacter litorisediminis]